MQPIVQVEALSKSFPINKNESVHVLKNLSFQAQAGEFVSIVGPSGSGKTTFLYCMSGLEQADSGIAKLCGSDVVSASRKERSAIRRKNASFIFQDYNLIDSMTALENVKLGLRFNKKRLSAKAIKKLFDRFGLSDKLDSYPAQLSGGQRQRVAIVRSLAVQPKILFADEPSGALDSASTRLLLDQLAQLHKTGTTVIMVTHDLEAAARADRAIVLRDGIIHSDIVNPTAKQLFSLIGSTE
ncbi:ABC transporter ATP-binding protein [Arcanobacterium phocae]|uniref:ABC transporter ATP-binding protein n=1 Tax=Arcanobacterium phocae TaxID=131112 RepID=UPI001E399338|nr:ABC transporter ATP-binding protein [Arcanobacterium phocae]